MSAELNEDIDSRFKKNRAGSFLLESGGLITTLSAFVEIGAVRYGQFDTMVVAGLGLVAGIGVSYRGVRLIRDADFKNAVARAQAQRESEVESYRILHAERMAALERGEYDQEVTDR